jgi:rRNA biogenesis protein RRP5
MGHVPITNISTQLTARLEAMQDADIASSAGSEDEAEEEEGPGKAAPELFELFRVGQYVRAVVSTIHAPGTTSDAAGLGQRARDDAEKSSRRVELSLVPERVNSGVAKADLKPKFTISAAVQSVEDHGYILDLGVDGVSGFLSFEDAAKGPNGDTKLSVGALVDTVVTKMSKNGRTCTVSLDAKAVRTSTLSEISSVTSLLPGALASALITSIVPSGLNLQLLGFFDATADLYHLVPGDVEENYKLGEKVNVRVLYRLDASTPPRFAVSLAPHILQMDLKNVGESEGSALGEAFPIGTALEAVRVVRVEAEHGLVVEVRPGVEGFIHVSERDFLA